MAEKITSVRLKVSGGQQVKAELTDVGKSGEQALNRIRDASTPAGRGLRVLDGAASDIRARIDAVSSGIGPVGAGLSRLGLVGSVAAGGIALVGAALAGGIREFQDWELSQRRLEAVLKATGYAAGLTGSEIDSYADEIEKTTLATAEGVKQAAAVLATFKSVSGETFTRALGLAQDMAAVFGGDVSTAATQLGKALEDPVEGLTALRRVGVTFSAEQKRVIADLYETGRTAEAQRVILDALAGQVGGAGAAEGDTLTGAFKHATDSVGDLLQRFAEVTGAAGGVRAALDSIARGAKAVVAATQTSDEDALAAARGKLAALGGRPEVDPRMLRQNGSYIAGRQQREYDAERAKILAEIAKYEDRIDTADKQRATAGMGAARQARNAQEEKLVEIYDKLEKQLKGVATDEEKVAAIRKETTKTIASIEGQRLPGGTNDAEIERAKAAARQLEERRIAEVFKKASAETGRDNDRFDDLIGDLTAAAANIDDRRAAFIRSYTERLGASATPQQEAQVKALAANAYDEQLARTIRDAADPTREYNRQLTDLNRLLAEGKISEVAYADAVARANEEMARGADDIMSRRRDALSGLQSSLGAYARDATNMARNVANAAEGILSSTEDAITSVFAKGKIDIKGFVDSILADLARLLVRQTITGPLSSLLSSGLSNAFGGGATGAPMNLLAPRGHVGGHIGGGLGLAGSYPMSLWSDAPRYHEGGTVLRPGERPIIAKVGEQIRTAEQQARDAAARGPQVNISVQNESTSARADVQRGPSGRPDDLVIRMVDRGMARGDVRSLSNYGVRPPVIRR